MNRILSTTVLAATCVVALALEPREADACGGGFWSSDVTVESSLDAQRTLLVYDGTRIVRHYVQVSYSGSPKEFAWVYPLPSNPDPPAAVEDGDTLFGTLETLTKPTFHVRVIGGDDGDSGGGCLCIGMMGAADDGRQDYDASADGGDGVTIWGGGRVGIFDYVIITADTIDPMITWLNDNSFRVPPEASPVLEHYVDGGFYFVAMKINPEAEGVSGEGSTTTILFRYPLSERVYPLHMASIGSAANTSVLLYVLAEHRVQAGPPYENVLIDPAELTVTPSGWESYTVNYEQTVLDTVARAGGRAFITEYVGGASDASSWSTTLADLREDFSPTLTRLRSTLGPAQMTDDVELANSPTDSSVSRTFELTHEVAARGSNKAPDFLLALAVPAAIVFFFRLRRRPALPPTDRP